jgi:hypothetical protein
VTLWGLLAARSAFKPLIIISISAEQFTPDSLNLVTRSGVYDIGTHPNIYLFLVIHKFTNFLISIFDFMF